MSPFKEEEDWKEEDGMDQEDFGPEKYFHLHDTDQDGRLSQEVREGVKEIDFLGEMSLRGIDPLPR